EEIALAEQPLQLIVSRSHIRDRIIIRGGRATQCNDVHAERVRAPCDRATDAAIPDDAEGGARELAYTAVARLVEVGSPFASLLRAHGDVESAREMEHHAEHGVRDRL